MTDVGFAALKQQFETFNKASSLEVVVPKSKSAIEALSTAKTVDDIHRVPTRQTIFFDEKITVSIVLRSSAVEADVNAILEKAELRVSAHATNAVADGSGNTTPAAAKYEVASALIDVKSSSIHKIGSFIHVVWSHTLHVTRPNGRLSQPAIYFTAVFCPAPPVLAQGTRNDKRYLQSFETQPANILGSLQLSDDAQVFVSEARVTKMTPRTIDVDSLIRPLRGVTKRAYPALPIVYLRLISAQLYNRNLLSLHIETAHHLPVMVTIGEINVESQGTEILPIEAQRDQDKLLAGDEIVRVFDAKLGSESRKQDIRMATVSIKGSALLDQDTPIEVEVRWQTQIQLSPTGGAKISGWSAQSTQQDSKDSPHAGPGSVEYSFRAPQRVDVGSEFAVQLQCINSSTTARQFEIAVRETTSSSAATMLSKKGRKGALVVTPRLKTGRLDPGTCFETNLRYRCAEAGVQDLGSLRVVDLDSDHFVDVVDLPDVVAQPTVAVS